MGMITEEGYKFIDGGVCAAQGFKANGLNCGLNPDKEKFDLGMFVSETVCNTACVYTTNKVKGAPILVTKKNLELSGGRARAMIANSKNANTCNVDGEEKAAKMCELLAKELSIKPEEVIVASTGVIGNPLPLEPIASHIKPLVAGLSTDGNGRAEYAIMTTDTFAKEVAVEFELDGVTCHMGGMAKGSGMIHPNMATTLNFVTTDAAVETALLQKALSDVVKITYNCLSIDGDTSTNDMVCFMANGLAGNKIVSAEDAAYEIIKKALYVVLVNLTRLLAKDGEGASKLLVCECVGAKDQDNAIVLAKSVIHSPLFKCAVFGEDANWGRVLCAMGYSGADFDVSKADVDFESEYGRIALCRGGFGVGFSEEEVAKILSSDEIKVIVNLNEGDASATAWGCDLTYDYVKINGDYRS